MEGKLLDSFAVLWEREGKSLLLEQEGKPSRWGDAGLSSDITLGVSVGGI